MNTDLDFDGNDNEFRSKVKIPESSSDSDSNSNSDSNSSDSSIDEEEKLRRRKQKYEEFDDESSDEMFNPWGRDDNAESEESDNDDIVGGTDINGYDENDMIPWSEQFRPKKIDDILSHGNIKESFKNYIKLKKFPHFLLHGPPGTGKTSSIKAFAREYYGDDYKLMILEINASEDRGIEMIRSKIKGFVISKSNFYSNKNKFLFKLVILDEADAMTREAQAMLRYVIESYTNVARFCIICNYKIKIIKAIQSRCTLIKFSPIAPVEMKKSIKKISKDNDVKVTPGGMDMLVKICKGDMRNLLNLFQSTSTQGETIDKDFLTECTGYPNDTNIKKILKFLNGTQLVKNIHNIKKYIIDNRLMINDIISELMNTVYEDAISGKCKNEKIINISKGLSMLELNLCSSPNFDIQLGALASLYFIENHK